MIDHTRKQYRKLVGMLFLKKLTNYGLLALLTIEVFFLFSCMTQGVTFNGIVTLTKNPFYPETVNTAVVNGNFLDLFTTIVTIAGMATLFLTKIIRCCECCGVMAPIALDNEHPRI